MRRQFGWGLPPGVTNHMIEEQAGAFEEEKMNYPYSLRIDSQIDGFYIRIYEEVPITIDCKPDIYKAKNTKELLDFLKGIYEKQ